jgi:hypothetical protein
VVLGTSACHPDQPATKRPAGPAAPDAGPTDTLHLPGGVVTQLRSITAAAFQQLPVGSLFDLPNDPGAEHLSTEEGPEVHLASTPDAQFTLQNGEGVKYLYCGGLPAAHQWAVWAWAWESSSTVAWWCN